MQLSKKEVVMLIGTLSVDAISPDELTVMRNIGLINTDGELTEAGKLHLVKVLSVDFEKHIPERGGDNIKMQEFTVLEKEGWTSFKLEAHSANASGKL